MSGALCRIVAVGDKVAAVFGAVATYKVSLHARRLVLIRLEKLRHHRALEALLGVSHDFVVRDDMIPAAFVAVVVKLHRLAADLAHET